jgi:hypothetical protein
MLAMMKMIISLEQELITTRINGVLRRGLKVGDYLYVLPHPYGHLTQRKIYKLHNNKPLSNAVLDHVSAIELAENYTKTYFKFLCLWQEYPDMVLHEVTKYTVKDGLEKCKYFQERL